MTVRTVAIPVILACAFIFTPRARAQSPSRAPSGTVSPSVPAAAVTSARKMGRIGIETFGPAGLSVELRTRLQEAAAAGLRASGAQVVSWSEVARGRAALSPCTDWACEQRLAKVIDTQHWLRGTCQVDASTYRLHLELVDAQTGEVQAARDDTCDICTEADATETANVAASALKASFGRSALATAVSPRLSASAEQARSAHASRPAAPPLGASASASASASATGAARAERDGSADLTSGPTQAPLWRRILPWATLGAAAGATAGGIYYLAIDNRGIDCPQGNSALNCPYYNDTLWRWGVPLVAAGAALATAGIVLMLTGDDSDAARTPGARASVNGAPRRSTRLVISGDRLTLAGTF